MSKKIDTGAIAYYNDVAFNAIDSLTEKQEIELFNKRTLLLKEKPDKKNRKNINEIDNILVLSTIKMAYEIALRYATNIPGIDIKDAIQEANEALIDAIRLYNPEKKGKDGLRIKFRTYAYIRAEYKVKDYIMNNSRLVRLPRSKLDDLFLLIEAIESLSPEDTIEELRIKLNEKGSNMKIEEVYKSLELLQGIHTSLDQTVRNESVGKDQTLKDIIPVPEDVLNQEQTLDVKMATELLNSKVKEILAPYKDMTYEVIYYRFLDPSLNKIRTYEETAKALYINKASIKILSKEWIRQLESIGVDRIHKRAPELKDIL